MTFAAPVGAGAARATAPDIAVTLTDQQEDVDEALRLVHDAFVDAGYMRPQPTGRRLHPAYLNPGALFALARTGGEAVGAMALIPDGPFGLPCERAFAEEIDAMRELSAGPVVEGGSLSVREEWRRHTRRIFVRLMAAVARVGFSELPDATVVFTVPPEAERFYRGLYGCEAAAEPRPLYGAPAVLMRTTVETLSVSFERGLTSAQRMMGALTGDPDPDWLEDRRSGMGLHGEWLAPLLAETGVAERLDAQARLLAAATEPVAR